MVQGYLIEDSWSHLDTSHSVDLLWTSDQPEAETSTWQHITLTWDIHPCPRRDSNPQSREASGRRPTPQTARPLGSIFRPPLRVKNYVNWRRCNHSNGSRRECLNYLSFGPFVPLRLPVEEGGLRGMKSFVIDVGMLLWNSAGSLVAWAVKMASCSVWCDNVGSVRKCRTSTTILLTAFWCSLWYFEKFCSQFDPKIWISLFCVR